MYDDICKFIAETFSRDLASWLLGESIELTLLEPTELQVAPIRADSLIFLQSEEVILHIEFQTDPKADVPFRMADYRLRLHRRYPNRRVYQVVIYLRKTNSPLVGTTTFDLPELHHEYNVIRLWEVPSEQLLEASGLLPFAVLSQTENRLKVLEEVARKIGSIEERTEQSNVAAATAILAGLVLDKIIVSRLLREEIMKESVIYQDIQAKGEAKLVLRQLHRKIGEIPDNLSEQIRELSIEQLENLGEALLDFESQADLEKWIEDCRS